MNRKGADDGGRKKKSDKKKDPPPKKTRPMVQEHRGAGSPLRRWTSEREEQYRHPTHLHAAQKAGTVESLDAPPKPPPLFGSWTGKTPVTMLNEWCQKNKWARPNFSPVKSCPEGFRWRVVLINLTNKKTEEKYTHYTRDPLPVSDMARCLHRVLPPEMRDLWAQLDIDAKEKKEKDTERAQKAEEVKEKKENLEKRLQKMPQIYMSPTARSLVENIISSLRSRQPPVTAQSRPVDSDLAADDGGFDPREAEEEIDLGWDGEEEEDVDRAAAKAEEAKAKRMAEKTLRRRLKQLGWRKEDVDRVLAALPERDLPPTDDLNKRVKKVLDWLLLHVAEEHLPVEYQPAKTLEIGITAFPSAKQPKSGEERELELLQADTKNADKATDSFYTLFALIARRATKEEASDGCALKLESSSAADAVAALPKKGDEREAWEIEELRRDEMLALEAILGDDFTARSVAVAGLGGDALPVDVLQVRLPPDSLSLEASAFQPFQLALADLRLEFHIPAHPHSLYPLQLPLVFPSVSLTPTTTAAAGRGGGAGAPAQLVPRVVAKLKHRIIAELAAQAQEMLGEAMVYSLCQWLQSNIGQLVRAVVESEQRPTVAVAAPTNQQPQKQPQPAKAANGRPDKAPTVTVGAAPQGQRGGAVAGRSAPRRPRGQPQVSEEQVRELSAQLTESLRAKQQRPDYIEMQRVRQRLPAASKREEIIRVIRNNQVIVLTGATGCGKSTQVPQYIMEDMIAQNEGGRCNIIVTQPRRISALGLAQRVSAEQCEDVGNTVGYQIRLESAKSKNTRLLFCTTGILLRRLTGSSGEDKELRGISHIIVDEVHERNLDSDFLLIVLKELVRARKDIKVILMSATLDADLFAHYFASPGGRGAAAAVGAPVISIPGFTYPVGEHYLEDALELLRGRGLADDIAAQQRRGGGFGGGVKRTKAEKEEDAKRREDILRSYAAYSVETREALATINENKLEPALLEHLIFFICEEGERTFPELSEEKGSGSKGAILVFFSGMADILTMLERLQRGARDRRAEHKYLILPLHSSISTAQQQRVFERPPQGVRKIILSTNIAETSVTIDDVVVVIDTGKMNEMQYDPVSKLSCLGETWIAKANAAQRRGRAGRVKKGLCFKLYTERRHADLMDQRPPEILRVPLEQLCLQIKLLNVRATVKQFLHQALQPPEDHAIQSALNTLHQVNALEKEEEKLTPLGYHLAQLPVDVHIGKMMLFGAILCCLDPVLTIAAAMSAGKSAFYSPPDRREEANQARFGLALDKSDHLTLMNAYNGWLAAKADGREMQYCNDAIADLKRQYAELLSEIGFLDQRVSTRLMNKQAKLAGRGSDGVKEATGARLNINAKNTRVIKAALCCGLYPNVVRISSPETRYVQVIPGSIAQPHNARDLKFYTRDDGRVFLHPSSVNFSVNEFDSPWLLFSEKVKTSKVFVRQSSMVSHYPLLLFGREIDVVHHLKIIKVDDWIQFRADPRIAVLTKELKVELDKLLTAKISDPTFDISHSGLIEVITQLISTDGLIGPQEAAKWS
ncbi:helicase conserved Cterminal domain containing protein [Acanthamoeba castellanii str. Neff]|uniref:RNA helicase n=1 Tax=Acanthamoeba castellanii (strain ATCC 30010 / Neff) TaxID=1257118 RepID=L8HMU6_ACACF|nr:helicase conserved Cterminal domain containing protein [Acanthamoeba castellanii str. Neff]ELR25721.1 helicase conserved Cterminal domain containing protein [Acanthamoeba castellanii str. Neff]